MKPLKPIEHYEKPDRDHAKDGYSLGALEDLINNTIPGQPDWRSRAAMAHSFYDMGKQLTPERERYIRNEMGIEPRQTNLINGIINGVLGQEAKARSDVRVEADDEDFGETCDVLSKAIFEVRREANVDVAVSNGYAGLIKAGIGWVEVSRASDPLDYYIRVQDVGWREMYWDMRAKRSDMGDCRWMIRKRWMDLDEAVAAMPDHKEVLKHAINGWSLIELQDIGTAYMRRSYNTQRTTTIHRDEWCDNDRNRIKFYEVWYRVPAEAVVIQISPTRRIVYDENNPLHQQVVSRGRAKLSKESTMQVRMALFAGPHRLIDVATTKRNFPYIPFFGFKDDEDQSPYGLIEGMISTQEEYNERRQHLIWLLRARQVVVDGDAMDERYNNIESLRRTAAKPNMVAVLDPNRRNINALKIGQDIKAEQWQFDAMQDAKILLQELPRVYSTQLGNAPTGVTSGIAINSLTEQGVVAMGELNDNHRFARKQVHEQILEIIVENHSDENLRVMIGSGSSRRAIVMNSWSPEGAPINRVKDAPVRVGLSDVPTSPAFRMQQQQQIAQMIVALQANPAAMNILAPAYLENSGLENGKQMADDLRRASGAPVSGDRNAQAQAQQQQQAMLQKQAQMADQAAAADQAEKASKVRLNDATTTLKAAQAHEVAQDTALALHGVERDALAADSQTSPEDAAIQASMAEAMHSKHQFIPQNAPALRK